MRSSSRVVSTLLLAIAAASCTESPTNARRAAASLAIVPRFSPQAQAIYRNLAAFAVTLDNVHIVVRGEPVGDGPGAVLKDTLVAFPATADQITIELELEITGTEQRVVATVDLQSGSAVYFEGTEEFVARVGDTDAVGEPVPMSYVGPGASATSLTIFPTISSQPVTIAPLGSSSFQVQAQDQSEHVVAGLPVTWRTLDPTIATVSTEGVVTATSKAGSTTLIATGLNGISAQTTIDVQPVTQLVAIGGGNQTGTVGSQLAANMTVQAIAANGHFVSGATITFAAANGLGTVSQSSVATDLTGLATTTLTLGQAIGTYTFTATVVGAPSATTRVTASATSGTAAALGIVGGSNQVDSVAATLAKPLSVKVTDAFGNPVAQQAVDFVVTSQNALLLAAPGAAPVTPVRVVTGTDGVAAVSVVGGTIAGTVVVTASLAQSGIAPVTFTETLGAANAVQLLIVQQPSKTAQATLPLGTQPKVQVADQFGNPVPLAGLAIGASYQLDCTRTGCGTLRQPSTAGASLNRSPSITRQRSGSAVTRASSRKLAPSSRIIGLTVPLRPHTASVAVDQGLAGTTSVTTDANGTATFSDLTLNLSVGLWQLIFFDARESLAVAISDDIALSAGPVDAMIQLPPDSSKSVFAFSGDTSYFSLAGDVIYPRVQVIDAVGNGVPGIAVSFASVDESSFLDGSKNLTTKTDADGFATPGGWVMPGSSNFSTFAMQASADIPGSKGLQLVLYATWQPPIGRIIPPTMPAPSR
jgi:hypothetical protein